MVGKMKIVFAGGGTGGHIYPGIAVADELSRIAREQGRECQIYWIGNNSGMDKNIVEKFLIPSDTKESVLLSQLQNFMEFHAENSDVILALKIFLMFLKLFLVL